jgi:hypothetical protein
VRAPAILVAAAALVTVLPGCQHGSAPPSAASTTRPTYALPPRTVRPFETPLAGATAGTGPVSVAVIGLRPHAPYLVGTHAEFDPKGEFCRLRVAVQNDAPTFQTITLADMLLVTADGTAHRPDLQAMLIKRQPDEITLGAQGRVEFDLWYDVPVGSKLRALRARQPGLEALPEIPLPPT